MSRAKLILLTNSVLAYNALTKYQYMERTYPNSTEPEKRCIVCGKLRYHNNSFCSKECCTKYKNESTVQNKKSAVQ